MAFDFDEVSVPEKTADNFEYTEEWDKITIPEDIHYILKICLKGNVEALHHAYRRSIRALAEFDKEFGADSMPGTLVFKWESIKGYRVLSIMTEGPGITVVFSDIPGITDYLWAIYDDNSNNFTSNDAFGILINDKQVFGLPDVDYEIVGGSSTLDGTLSFDASNPNILTID